MLITDALARFLRQAEANGRARNTTLQLHRHVRLLATWLESRGHCGDVRALTDQDLAAFVCSPAATQRPDRRPKGPTSMNALRSSLRSFGAYIHEAGLAPRNPAQLLKRAIADSPPPRALSIEEEARLEKVLDRRRDPASQRDRVLVALLRATGLRIGEALRLDLADLDLARGTLLVRQPKGNRPRRAYLAPEIADLLRAHVGRRTKGRLFLGARGEPLTTRHVQRRFARARAEAGIPSEVRLHTLRATFAQDLLDRTQGDLLLVSKALGHRSIASTLRYVAASEDRLRALFH